MRDIGLVEVGDTIRIGASGPDLTVLEVVGTTQVGVDYQLTSNTSVPAGTRLLITGRRPTLYQDAMGQATLSPTLTTNASLGQAGCYVRDNVLDYVVTSADFSPRVYPDTRGGVRGGELSWVNARGFPDLQAALDACVTGGTVFFPAGDYTVPSGGLIIAKTLCLRGETGTRLFPHSVATGQPILKLYPGGAYLPNVTIRDLVLMNATRPASKVTGNHGIQCDVPTDGSKVASLVVENVQIVNMGDDAIHLDANATNDSFFVFVRLVNVHCVLSRGSGLFLKHANLVSATDCYMNANEEYGVIADRSELVCINTAFENNCQSSSLDSVNGGQVYLLSCAISRFDACHWENFTTSSQPSNKRALTVVDSPCCTVSSCWFANPEPESSATSQRGIYCRSSGSGDLTAAMTILPNRFTNVKTAIEIEAGTQEARDCIIFPQFINGGTGSILLPTDRSNNGLTAFGMRSSGTLRGNYIPALASNALPTLTASDAGFTLYDTTNDRIRMWDGTVWRTLQV